MKKIQKILAVSAVASAALFMVSPSNAFWSPFNMGNGPGWGGYNNPLSPWGGGYPGGYGGYPYGGGYPAYGYPGGLSQYPGYGGGYPAYGGGHPGYGYGGYPAYGAPYGGGPMLVPAN